MKNSGRSLLIGSLIMLGTVTVGISGYLLANWTFIDALFMVVITIFGEATGLHRAPRHSRPARERIFSLWQSSARMASASCIRALTL